MVYSVATFRTMAEPTDARRVFARNLRAARTRLELSQERLADLSGLHRTYVSSVERSERNISIDNMERLARALKTPLAGLLDPRGI